MLESKLKEGSFLDFPSLFKILLVRCGFQSPATQVKDFMLFV